MFDHSPNNVWPVRQDISLFDFLGEENRKLPYPLRGMCRW
jgi:hypothetical protein